MKVLICGDSFCVTDHRFLGLHWSEKLANRSSDFEILNMSYGGCSNAMILLQILQGLQFNPEFLIVSFTSLGRYELDKDTQALPLSTDFRDLTDWIKSRYITNMYESAVIDPAVKKCIADCSNSFETIKNYFFVVLALQHIAKTAVPFCYSLGGFEFCEDYTAVIRENFLPNLLQDYDKQELQTNLWYHTKIDPISPGPKPFFHVSDDRVQTLFYNECLAKIEESNDNRWHDA